MSSLLIPVIYFAFISLGLPDSLLGASWPIIHTQWALPLSWAGIISFCISICTVTSSLVSDNVTRKFGPGKVTAVSVLLTALALLGFSISTSFWHLMVFAIPYGLGAGSIDTALNNYVAIHYKSRHMSWLHCMWGVGTSIGPIIMGQALAKTSSWQNGYFIISLIQASICLVMFFTLGLWKTKSDDQPTKKLPPQKFSVLLKSKGAPQLFLTFLSYCGVEQTAILWGSTYLVSVCGFSETLGASLASLFCIGITVGRALSGFLTFKFSDLNMVRMGQAVIALGAVVLLLNISQTTSIVAFLLIGLGCAPIYPSTMHSVPTRFGNDKSQKIIGMTMASAFLGITLLPPLFGLIAQNISASLFPIFILANLVVMILCHERLEKLTGSPKEEQK